MVYLSASLRDQALQRHVIDPHLLLRNVIRDDDATLADSAEAVLRIGR